MGGRKRKEPSSVRSKASSSAPALCIADEQVLRQEVAKLTDEHHAETTALIASYQKCYARWRFDLLSGYNLLFYGVGSKKALLEHFAATSLTDTTAVCINGYLPSVSLKQVIQTLAAAVGRAAGAPREEERAPKQPPPGGSSATAELLRALAAGGESISVIVHNVDGPGVRGPEAQRALAELAASPSVHMVASVDNINAPLLWDRHAANAEFTWWWRHTPTYAPYREEAACLPPLLSASRAEKAGRGALVVLQSLTPNARGAFRLLAEHQLAATEEAGLSFQRWYALCREKFLVSSDVTLRTHWAEFKDHELVRTRRDADGQELLYIPMSEDALSKLLVDFEAV